MSRTAVCQRQRQRGFTLIEVLVALGIVALTLMAGLQASAALSRDALRQTQVVLGHLCAENELVKARLLRQLPGVGDTRVACNQGASSFTVTVTVRPTPNPNFRRIDAQVSDADTPLLQLSTVMGRY